MNTEQLSLFDTAQPAGRKQFTLYHAAVYGTTGSYMQKLLFEVFECGFDYGQLKAEEERDMEEWGEAFLGHIFSRKYSMPMQPAERRQARSEKWREAKMKSYHRFLEIMVGTIAEEEAAI